MNWPMTYLTIYCIPIHLAYAPHNSATSPQSPTIYCPKITSKTLNITTAFPTTMLRVPRQTSSLMMRQFLKHIISQVRKKKIQLRVQLCCDGPQIRTCQGYLAFRTSAKLARNLWRGSRERWLYDHGVYFKIRVGRSQQSHTLTQQCTQLILGRDADLK